MNIKLFCVDMHWICKYLILRRIKMFTWRCKQNFQRSFHYFSTVEGCLNQFSVFFHFLLLYRSIILFTPLPPRLLSSTFLQQTNRQTSDRYSRRLCSLIIKVDELKTFHLGEIINFALNSEWLTKFTLLVINKGPNYVT